jgi:hypothetical protein
MTSLTKNKENNLGGKSLKLNAKPLSVASLKSNEAYIKTLVGTDFNGNGT